LGAQRPFRLAARDRLPSSVKWKLNLEAVNKRLRGRDKPLQSDLWIQCTRPPKLGTATALTAGMRISVSRFVKAALLSAALIAPIAIMPATLLAQKVVIYHDKAHNDDHQWNDHEDRAYRMWVKEGHRKNTDFARLRASDQQAYWGWRHEHSDAILKIDIR
jgi:hypothetical protein